MADTKTKYKYITVPGFKEADYNLEEANEGGARMGSFAGHLFTVSPTLIRSFDTLAISAGSETENKTADKEQYVNRKSGKAKKVTMNVTLNALVGCNPHDEALAFSEDAENGVTAYLYIGGEKLFPCPMMLTQADTSEVQMAPNGQWVSCKVALTFQQAAKNDGGYAKIKQEIKDTKDTTDGTGTGTDGTTDGTDGETKTTKDYAAEIEAWRKKAADGRTTVVGGGSSPVTRIQIE